MVQSKNQQDLLSKQETLNGLKSSMHYTDIPLLLAHRLNDKSCLSVL